MTLASDDRKIAADKDCLASGITNLANGQETELGHPALGSKSRVTVPSEGTDAPQQETGGGSHLDP